MPEIIYHVDMKVDVTGNSAGFKNVAGEQKHLVTAQVSPLTGGGIVKTISNLTQAQYDALAVKDPEVLYVIVG